MANNGEFSNDQPLKEAKITFLSSHTQGLRLIGFWCPVHGFKGLGLSVGSKAGVLLAKLQFKNNPGFFACWREVLSYRLKTTYSKGLKAGLFEQLESQLDQAYIMKARLINVE